jgi:hypothetical protein
MWRKQFRYQRCRECKAKLRPAEEKANRRAVRLPKKLLRNSPKKAAKNRCIELTASPD